MLALIQGMIESGHEVELVALRDSKYLKRENLKCKCSALEISSLISPLSIVKLIKFAFTIKKNNFQLVHTFFNDVSIVSPALFFLFGIPVLISRRDMGFWYTNINLKLLRVMEPIVSQYVANSDAVAQKTSEMEGVKRNKISVIYNGHKQNTESCETAGMDAKWEGTNICLVANYRPLKRIEDLIDAFNILVKSSCNTVRLHLIGSGTEQAVSNKLAELGLNEKVNLYEQLNDPQKIIRNCDIAVLCSESEGLSNAVIECMKAGLPVIATRTGGNPELVIDGVTGFLIEVGNVSALYQKLEYLISNPAIGKQFGEAGMRRISEDFGIELMWEKYNNLYFQIIQRSGPNKMDNS